MRRAEGPDRPPTIPPASGSGVTSSGAEGPDKPSATPVGLDTKDPEVQLSVLRWMMSKRVGEVRIFAGRWVRRLGPVHVPDWAKNLTKVNPEALEKGTHPRNHQVGGLPWARYSVDELHQQAKAGDRPYPADLRSIFWAFHWTRQISSWTLPGLLGMFGHSYTLRQLWGVWESLPLLQGPRQRGPKNKAQNVAPYIYRKLGYTNDMIKLMGLDPSAPGCRTGADGPDIRPRGGEGEGIVYPPITADNVHSVVGKDYRKKNYPVEMKHVFWAHMGCGLVLSSVTPWELIPKTKGETRGGYMCKYCKGYWRAGGGGTRLLQIRAGKATAQLASDEPPESLYNRWVKERLEYYRRVEPSAPLRDVSIVDQKVPRFRFSQTTQTGHVSNAIWELILRNPEAAALKRIDDIAKGAA